MIDHKRTVSLRLRRLAAVAGLLVCLSPWIAAQAWQPSPENDAQESKEKTADAKKADEAPKDPPADGDSAKGGDATSDTPKDDKADATGDDDPDPRRAPSADEILDVLSKSPTTSIVTPKPAPGREVRVLSPTAVPKNAVGAVQPKLLPDGYRMVDRAGRLAREADYYVFSFEDQGRGAIEAPIRLLPNRALEDMEVFSDGGEKSVVFVISGEVTEYHGVNYLLVQKLLTRPSVGNLKTGG